jgi:hypothetical protein
MHGSLAAVINRVSQALADAFVERDQQAAHLAGFGGGPGVGVHGSSSGLICASQASMRCSVSTGW